VNPSDAAAALARAAAFDRRTVGEVEARAWAEAIPADYTLSEVIAATVAHYAASTEFLMPAHITALVKRARAERRARLLDDPNAVPDADPDDVAGWLQALREGRMRDESTKQVVRRPVEAFMQHAAAGHGLPAEPAETESRTA
jgi:hypothetical protein